MTRQLLTGNEAAAWGARLAGVDYVPSFPITPQTEIIDTLSRWIDRGEMDARLVTLESEHSMLTAAGTAAATGVRVFTATSSQGLLYGMEMLYTLPGWRVPLVLVNVSRALSAPITLEPDHNDVLAARDSGFLQFHASTCQEVLDGILLSYRLAEDRRVRLPVLVNLDGFYLSFTREPVELPRPESIAEFLPPFDAGALNFGGGAPRAQGVAVLGGDTYSFFRYQSHLAATHALDVFAEAAEDFKARFGRDLSPVECHGCEDAEFVFVMIGAFSGKARAAVDRLRHEGWKIGLVRPRLLRPFPEAQLVEALAGRRAVAVIDQNLAPGRGGILHAEVRAALYHTQWPRPPVLGFIGGLGGRDIPYAEFRAIAETMRESAETGHEPPPRLLYTGEELQRFHALRTVAGAPMDNEGEGEGDWNTADGPAAGHGSSDDPATGTSNPEDAPAKPHLETPHG